VPGAAGQGLQGVSVPGAAEQGLQGVSVPGAAGQGWQEGPEGREQQQRQAAAGREMSVNMRCGQGVMCVESCIV
jgi:hypothetical protein